MHLCTLHIHVHVFYNIYQFNCLSKRINKMANPSNDSKYNIQLQSAIQVLGSVGFSVQTTAILFSGRLEIYVSDIFGLKF